MAQQIIDVGTTANDRTGDTWRDAMIKTNDNFTEVYDSLTAGNAVYVREKDDFPAPVLGIIELETKAYIIEDKIDLGTDVISLGEGTLIQGYTAEISGITTASGSPLITGSNLAFEAAAVKGGIQLDNTGAGAVARVEGSSIVFFEEILSLDSGGTVLEIDNLTGGVAVDKWTAINGVDGIIVTGTNTQGIGITLFNPAGLTGKGIDVQGDITNGTLRMEECLISVGDTAIDISGSVQGVSISGDVVSTGTGNGLNISGSVNEGLLINNAKVLASGNDGMDITGSTLSNLTVTAAGLVSAFAGGAGLKGDAGSANITNAAIISTSNIQGVGVGGVALSGITKKDIKYSFTQAGPDIVDSANIGVFTLDSTTTTTINYQGDEGSITAFADAGAGNTTVSTANTPATGAPVAIYGTTSYNGLFTAANVVAGVSFDIVRTYVANDATGTWESGWEKISGSTTAGSTIERFDLPNDNELRSLDPKTIPVTCTGVISAQKVGGAGAQLYEFGIFRDEGEGDGFVKINGSFTVDLDNRYNSIPIRVPTKACENSLFTLYVRNTENTNDIEAILLTADIGAS